VYSADAGAILSCIENQWYLGKNCVSIGTVHNIIITNLLHLLLNRRAMALDRLIAAAVASSSSAISSSSSSGRRSIGNNTSSSNNYLICERL
jgi:hypothetical protein